jgi:hypothetical protein
MSDPLGPPMELDWDLKVLPPTRMNRITVLQANVNLDKTTPNDVLGETPVRHSMYRTWRSSQSRPADVGPPSSVLNNVIKQQRSIDDFIHDTCKIDTLLVSHVEVEVSDDPIYSIQADSRITSLKRRAIEFPSDDLRPAKQAMVKRSANTPVLGHATYENECVSVLMRIYHSPISDKQETARNTALSSLTSLGSQAFAQPESTAYEYLAVFPSTLQKAIDDNASFQSFVKQQESVLRLIEQHSPCLKEMASIARQADGDFASSSPEAASFCDHLISMLDGIDPILDTIRSVLELPLEYRTLFQNKAVDLVEYLGLSAEVAHGSVGFLFETISQINEAVDDFGKKKKQVKNGAPNLGTSYRDFHKQVALVCSSDRYPQASTGELIKDLSTLMAMVNRRIEGTKSCFIGVRNLGDAIYATPEDKRDERYSSLTARLELVCKQLSPIADQTIINLESLTSHIQALYDALLFVHTDVRSFYAATHHIAIHCRKIEAKVIAADLVRSGCYRINNIIGPLKDLLGNPTDKYWSGKQTAELPDHVRSTVSEIFLEFLPKAVCSGITALLEEHFGFDDLLADMTTLHQLLDSSFESHVEVFDKSLKDLLMLFEPKEVITAEAEQARPHGPSRYPDVSIENLKFPLATPLFTASVAEELLRIVEDLTVLSTESGSTDKVRSDK